MRASAIDRPNGNPPMFLAPALFLAYFPPLMWLCRHIARKHLN